MSNAGTRRNPPRHNSGRVSTPTSARSTPKKSNTPQKRTPAASKSSSKSGARRSVSCDDLVYTDEYEDFIQDPRCLDGNQLSSRRVLQNLSVICAKYEREFKDCDIIDMENLIIVRNSGHLESLPMPTLDMVGAHLALQTPIDPSFTERPPDYTGNDEPDDAEDVEENDEEEGEEFDQESDLSEEEIDDGDSEEFSPVNTKAFKNVSGDFVNGKKVLHIGNHDPASSGDLRSISNKINHFANGPSPMMYQSPRTFKDSGITSRLVGQPLTRSPSKSSPAISECPQVKSIFAKPQHLTPSRSSPILSPVQRDVHEKQFGSPRFLTTGSKTPNLFSSSKLTGHSKHQTPSLPNPLGFPVAKRATGPVRSLTKNATECDKGTCKKEFCLQCFL